MDTNTMLNAVRAFLAYNLPESTGWGFSVAERNEKVLVWITNHPGNVNEDPATEQQIYGMLGMCAELQGREYLVSFTKAGSAAPVPAPGQPGGPALDHEVELPAEGFDIPGVKTRPVAKFKPGKCCANRCKDRVTRIRKTFWLCTKHDDAYKKKAKDGYLPPERDLEASDVPADAVNVTPQPQGAEPVADPAPAPVGDTLALAPIPNAAPQLQGETQAFQQFLAQVQGMQVVDQAGLDYVVALLEQVKTKAKEVEGQRTLVTKPLNDAKKQVDSWYKPLKDALAQVEHALKAKILEAQQTFAAAQQALMLQAQQAQAQAQQAQAQGDVAGHFQGMQQVAQLATAAEVDYTPNMDGVQIRENWQYRIVDAAALPREYLCPDEKKIKAVVKAMKGQTQIPGIEVFDAQTVAMARS